MSSRGSRYRLDTWRQGAPVRAMVTQLVILAALIPSAVGGYWGSVWINLALCLAAAAWSVAAVWAVPALRLGPRKNAWVMALFTAGVIALALALVLRDPWFGFYAYAGYSYSILLLPWPWQLCGVAATALVAGTAQSTGVDKSTPAGLVAYAGIVAVNMLAACGLTWFLRRLEKEHEERGQMLAELRESNRRLEAALAENAGLHRQLLAQAREAGVLDERQRMAGEIHDTLAQGLTGIITQLQAAEHAADEPAEWRAHFAAATGLARESLAEARRSVDALRPEPLETASLSEALTAVAARWSALHGMEVQVTTTGTERPMLPQAETALLRTAQEALANVAKHAHATRVGVTLSYMDHEVALDVVDDGRGFEPAPPTPTARAGTARAGLATADPAAPRPAPARSRGFGLIAMRQRIEGLAGTLRIESGAGAGTGISACIPAAPAEPAE
jgi:signal transduction histidine kinase